MKFPSHPDYQEVIRNIQDPLSAYQCGMNLSYTLRPDWDRVKVDIQYRAIQAKFNQNAELR
jgi:predicted NAD-dependent protein-ADP-ribosyltransferase YbiA (DUF1768 family)